MKHKLLAIAILILGVLYAVNPLDFPGLLDDLIAVIFTSIGSHYQMVKSKRIDA